MNNTTGGKHDSSDSIESSYRVSKMSDLQPLINNTLTDK